MDDEIRSTHVAPLRLLVGSLIVAAALMILGFILGGTSASAAASDTSQGQLGSLIDSVGSTASDAVAGVDATATPIVAQVESSLPAPASQLLAAVAPSVAPVTDVVDAVTASAPVVSAVAPVASTVDAVITAVPATSGVLGEHPFASLLDPPAQAVDQVVGTVADAVTALTNAVPGLPVLGGSSGSGDRSADALLAFAPALAIPFASSSAFAAFLRDAQASPLFGSPTTGTAGGSLPTPSAPGGQSPGAPAATSGSEAAPPGPAGASGAAVVSDGVALHSHELAGASARAVNDELPSSPTFENDTTPD